MSFFAYDARQIGGRSLFNGLRRLPSGLDLIHQATSEVLLLEFLLKQCLDGARDGEKRFRLNQGDENFDGKSLFEIGPFEAQLSNQTRQVVYKFGHIIFSRIVLGEN